VVAPVRPASIETGKGATRAVPANPLPLPCPPTPFRRPPTPHPLTARNRCAICIHGGPWGGEEEFVKHAAAPFPVSIPAGRRRRKRNAPPQRNPSGPSPNRTPSRRTKTGPHGTRDHTSRSLTPFSNAGPRIGGTAHAHTGEILFLEPAGRKSGLSTAPLFRYQPNRPSPRFSCASAERRAPHRAIWGPGFHSRIPGVHPAPAMTVSHSPPKVCVRPLPGP